MSKIFVGVSFDQLNEAALMIIRKKLSEGLTIVPHGNVKIVEKDNEYYRALSHNLKVENDEKIIVFPEFAFKVEDEELALALLIVSQPGKKM